MLAHAPDLPAAELPPDPLPEPASGATDGSESDDVAHDWPAREALPAGHAEVEG